MPTPMRQFVSQGRMCDGTSIVVVEGNRDACVDSLSVCVILPPLSDTDCRRECLDCPSQRVLRSLHALLYHYLPALFVIGHDVRRLTWEGGVRGTVKGDVAKRVLESCLALQVHLLGDWDARTEYCRTLAVALLGWQPYMTQLPGCAFVEEACEAMLPRMVGRCRANRNLQTFNDMQRLFVTLP